MIHFIGDIDTSHHLKASGWMTIHARNHYRITEKIYIHKNDFICHSTLVLFGRVRLVSFKVVRGSFF